MGRTLEIPGNRFDPYMQAGHSGGPSIRPGSSTMSNTPPYRNREPLSSHLTPGPHAAKPLGLLAVVGRYTVIAGLCTLFDLLLPSPIGLPIAAALYLAWSVWLLK